MGNVNLPSPCRSSVKVQLSVKAKQTSTREVTIHYSNLWLQTYGDTHASKTRALNSSKESQKPVFFHWQDCFADTAQFVADKA